MEFEKVVRARRMVRRFDPDRPVPRAVLAQLVDLARRSPSAGFAQGTSFVALLDPADRRGYWAAATDRDPGKDAWLAGVSAAPALVVVVSDPRAYTDRYSHSDKTGDDRDPTRWPIPYWDTDAAMAAMLLLLGAVDRGLGALFFGVPPASHDDVKRFLGLDPAHRLVGVVALGHEARRVGGSETRRPRRALAEVLYEARFGESLRDSEPALGKDGPDPST